MRGWVSKQATMLSLVGPEQRVPKNHPIRRIKALADEQLESLSPVFDSMYAELGRPSIPPETLLKGCLLIALFRWMKTVGGMRKTHYRGQQRVGLHLHWVAAAYNLVRMAKLMPALA